MKGYIIEMLEKYKNLGRISFSMPGHKNKKTADIFKDAADVTELADTDSLYNPRGAVKKACEKIAGIAGSDESFIMVNGSTGGIFAMIASVCKRGDTLLASRACHMSVINACVVLGVNLIFFEHKIYSKYSIHGEADISDISRKISENAVKAVLITSPNYFGAVSDIRSILDLLKGTDIPLLVDEAHGGHFFAGGVFPESAVCLGADMVVESMHKTPAGLNQSAVLHVKSGRIDLERVRDMLAVFQTSSPSYPIAASAESAFYETVHGGWGKTAERCGKLKKVLLKKTKIKRPFRPLFLYCFIFHCFCCGCFLCYNFSHSFSHKVFCSFF